MAVEYVWISTELTNNLAKLGFMVSFGTAAPTAPYSNCIVDDFLGSDDEEWYYSAPLAPARYVMIGKSNNDCTIIANNEKLRLRKVAVFGPLCDSSSITATLLTAYPVLQFTGAPLSIPWPTYSISPSSCFSLENLLFKDQFGNDLALDGTIAIDWVSRTITYSRQTAIAEPYIVMFGVFNSLPSHTDAGT